MKAGSEILILELNNQDKEKLSPDEPNKNLIYMNIAKG
jgi:hypothetical protein